MSLRAELLRVGLRMFFKWRSHPLDIASLRRGMSRMEKFVPRPPARTDTAEVNAGRLTLYRVTTPASRPESNVLYLHGGAYVSGAPVFYRHFTWRIAEALGACVWVLTYRLAPEHPFPAALEDAVAGYTWLTDNTRHPGQIVVMGDSAGAGLTLCLLLKLRDDGTPLPGAAVAMSPWTDLALTGKTVTSNAAADPMLNAEHLPQLAGYYLGGADPRTPYASPLYGDPAGLPPVLIQVGGDEILRDDAVRMAEKLRAENPGSRLEIWPRMPHVWQLFVPFLPEARRAITQIKGFISDVQSRP
ncbi:MAG TPA: alpha/beta hydrolase [Bradyrhizobium sp.]|nr:alpha/beta hydrolase [Bradyrhizobium sp.]